MRKKMIEVAIPLDAINRESAREKSIRHGHPSTLHLWWARRPLAACRAVIFTSLVDDPESDPANLNADGSLNATQVEHRRKELFGVVEDLVRWESSIDASVIRRARAEIASSIASAKVFDGKEWQLTKAVCGCTVKAFLDRTAPPDAVDKFLAENAPTVLDPFAGGGSIPLEAQRLGLRVLARDLNPVPVLINRALVEVPPRFANCPPVNPDRDTGGRSPKKTRQKTLKAREWQGTEGLAADVLHYGTWMRNEAEKRIGHFFPKVAITKRTAAQRPDLEPYVGKELTVLAWLWARTVQCPNPVCRARAPLVRSFWLAKKKGKECYLKPVIDEAAKTVRFAIARSGNAPQHTTDRTGARCLFCGTFIKKQQLRDIASENKTTEVPLGVVAEGVRERVYLPAECITEPPQATSDENFLTELITNDRRWFSPPLYGLTRFRDLFTPRQIVALTTFSDLVAEARESILKDAIASGMSSDPTPLCDGGTGASAYADAVATYLGIAASKTADGNSVVCSWMPGVKYEVVRTTFSRQALPMTWDYAESNPFAGSSGDFLEQVSRTCKVLELGIPLTSSPGRVVQADAQKPPVDETAFVVSTDPPYYDNIGYADLSDFFYLWLRRTLSSVFPRGFTTVLTPKTEELIASAHRHNGVKDTAREFFESGLGVAFAHMRCQQHADYPLTVYYAFKQAETDDDPSDEDDTDSPAESSTASTGWETMLTALLQAGFAITGTWPMRTERSARTVGLGTNALASCIVLVCRPRDAAAPITSRRELVNCLKRELPNALRDLQSGNIAPVDLAQAAIGPGMAIYSRYSKVLESSGERLTVRTALALINQVLDEVLAEQEGDYDADTRWSLKWFEQFAHDDGPFGDANTLATAMSIGINGLVETGIVQAKAGKVRLLKRTELMNGRPETWDPATDTDIVHWEVCQYLIHALDTKGEAGAAALLRRINARYPGAAETARELAYRLYSICERKKWAQEAMAYNSLIVAWPEIVKLAQSSDGSGGEAQTTMF